MPWRKALFNTMYRARRPIWDTPVPDEIRALADGPNAVAPGAALDVGCGTSGNVAFLARHGWRAIGVDFSPAAIQKATAAAAGVSGASFIEADVTRLTEQGITGPFDLIIDNGCYHSLADDGKQALARELAAVAKPGALLVMWEGIRMRPNEIADRFSADFDIEQAAMKAFEVKRFGRRFTIDNARWYQLRRKAPLSAE
ncbi:class I SAM-dependent methyltransferase [Mycobacterium spongiae]|uniref:Methyltransferase domain-containing protein n=1 Tax=Mycobacterium spongiae TaxID=886343 RepID=A0A975JZF2_9MYCO|nr:class I SAM-dependent methyltransferase [Mycobacterium spongiae]QUR68135.1 methyltransferase domain-containing protein [Mycobacterium spongiae]